MPKKRIDAHFKVSLLGDAGYGKTSLLSRHINKGFTEGFISPAKYDFISTQVEFEHARITLQIWDTAEMARFCSQPSNYDPGYSSADVYILAVDLTDPEALNHASKELTKIRNPSYQVYIVGTKSDLKSDHKISENQIQEFVLKNKLTGYAITSAKDNKGIKEFFRDITQNLYDKFLHPNSKKPSTVLAQENKLIERLNKYIERVESHTLLKNGKRLDFAYGFWFFAKSRAVSREINYLIAKQLVANLQRGESIEDTFDDIDKIRDDIIENEKLNFFKHPHFVNRGINSSELNSIIDDGKKLISKAKGFI